MNDAALNGRIPSVIGIETEHGIYIGRIRIGPISFEVFQPPRAIAAPPAAAWNDSYDNVPDAYSFSDGHANTIAMAKAGSKLAQYALDNGLYIPSLDESDLQYRVFKPTADNNYCYARAGINLNADTPVEPYTPEFPAQTPLEAYRAGGPEAFAAEWHWTSTQYRAYADSAWVQLFGDGYQNYDDKTSELPVRLVRRLAIR